MAYGASLPVLAANHDDRWKNKMVHLIIHTVVKRLLVREQERVAMHPLPYPMGRFKQKGAPIRAHNKHRCRYARSRGDFCPKGRNQQSTRLCRTKFPPGEIGSRGNVKVVPVGIAIIQCMYRVRIDILSIRE